MFHSPNSQSIRRGKSANLSLFFSCWNSCQISSIRFWFLIYICNQSNLCTWLKIKWVQKNLWQKAAAPCFILVLPIISPFMFHFSFYNVHSANCILMPLYPDLSTLDVVCWPPWGFIWLTPLLPYLSTT